MIAAQFARPALLAGQNGARLAKGNSMRAFSTSLAQQKDIQNITMFVPLASMPVSTHTRSFLQLWRGSDG